MSLTIKTQKWRNSIPRYKAILSRKLTKVLLAEGKTLVKHLILLTPPHGGGEGQLKEKTKFQQKVGFAAVERGVKHKLRPVDELDMVLFGPESIKGGILRAAGIRASTSKKGKKRKRVNFAETQKLLRRLGFKGQVIKDADGSLHRKSRGSRGRPTGGPIVVVRPLTVKRYVKDAQKSVGRAKKGWATAARFVRYKVPAWILRSRGSAPGAVKLDRSNRLKPTLTVKNRVPYAGDFRALGITSYAAKLRGPSMRKKARKALNEVNRMRH